MPIFHSPIFPIFPQVEDLPHSSLRKKSAHRTHRRKNGILCYSPTLTATTASADACICYTHQKSDVCALAGRQLTKCPTTNLHRLRRPMAHWPCRCAALHPPGIHSRPSPRVATGRRGGPMTLCLCNGLAIVRRLFKHLPIHRSNPRKEGCTARAVHSRTCRPSPTHCRRPALLNLTAA